MLSKQNQRLISYKNLNEMEKRNEMLQNVLLDKDRIFDLKLFWFEMICSQLSDWNIKQI